MSDPANSNSRHPAPSSGAFFPAALIVAATLLVYIPVMRGGFFWDDYTFLVHNPLIEARDGLRRIWFTTEPPEYLPLTYTTHWIEWRLWGGHAEGPHAVNVLLHAASAVLLWRVLKRLRVPGAWLAGLLFAVHPVAVASAGWIMERKNVLSMALFAASVLAYLEFEEEGQTRRRGDAETRRVVVYLLSVILFLFALLAKTSVVMLPVVLLLCAWWRRGRISRKDLLRTLPFFALALALGLVTVWFQQHNAIQGEVVRPENFLSRAAAAGWIAWFYLVKALLPAGLCVIYPRWNVDGSSALAFAPLLLLAGGMALLWTRRKSSWGRAALFAAAYFLVMLLPVLGFLDMAFMRLSLVGDHLQYAAMIGVIAFVAALLARWTGEARARWPGAVAAAGCVAALALLTWGRASLYAGDGERAWRDNLEKIPANPAAWVAWHHLGDIYFRRAELEEPDSDAGARDYEAVVRCFSQVIKLNPHQAEAWLDRSNARYRLRQNGLALYDCDEAIRLKPGYAAAYYGRALIHFQLKEYGEAQKDVEAYRALGGRPGKAFLEALRSALSP